MSDITLTKPDLAPLLAERHRIEEAFRRMAVEHPDEVTPSPAGLTEHGEAE